MEIAIKERPILFSTPMVQAILPGQKTQTRRVVKPQPEEVLSGISDTHGMVSFCNQISCCPYGKVGDVLWVRETWKPKYVKDGLEGFKNQYPTVCPWIYLADGEGETGNWYGSWKPSIHMPREACRLRLEITKIRVERLKDISEADAIAEGIEYKNNGELDCFRNYKLKNDFSFAHRSYFLYQEMLAPIASFSTLWESINGTDSWNENPWVWVIEFKKL